MLSVYAEGLADIVNHLLMEFHDSRQSSTLNTMKFTLYQLGQLKNGNKKNIV